MPKLIILSGHSRSTVYDLYKTTYIGRTDDCDLVLNHPSVSRRHAKLEMTGADISVEDLGSSNGILLNGNKLTQSGVQESDEIRIGHFTLVVLPDGEQFYKGRHVGYMLQHGNITDTNSHATRAIDSQEIAQLEAKRRLINGGRVTLPNKPETFWMPEDRKITFGGAGMIPVSGLFTSGVVAEVAWNGQAHAVRKLASMVGVKVNGKKVAEQALSHGDTLTIHQ
jgi:pSer/pThr/pTyr-binding forkhead associated (FHA) protein